MKWIKNYFKLIVFLVVLLVSFFVFDKFWVDLINKFWVNPIASKIGCNILWVLLVFSFVVIFYYILEYCYSKTLNRKRLVIVLTFSAINILCFFSDNWEYTSTWTSLIVILPIIGEIYLFIVHIIKNKSNKDKKTQELEREKTIGIEDSYNRENIYNTSYETLQTCFFEEGSFSVAISGSWGSGKTVFMEKLKEKYKKENKYVSIIEFEAWRCDTPNLIIRNFFTQLKNELKIYIPNISLDFDKYIDLLLDDVSVKPLKIISKAIYNICKQGKDPYNEIKDELKKSKHKVVVFIDDVDRLDADEIKEVLRLIRNTADFPYIQFIFTCDKDYICETLKKKDIEKPELYLEKFINIEISLPKYEERIICEELYNLISKTITKVWGNNVADNEIKDMIYYKLMDKNETEINRSEINRYLIPKILRTNRDVIHFYNTFKLIAEIYKTQKNQTEIEFQDLFFIELLKFKYPKLHSALWKNTFDFFTIINQTLVFNDEGVHKATLLRIHKLRKNKTANTPTQKTNSDNNEFHQLVKSYINDNKDINTPIYILKYLFNNNRSLNNPIYQLHSFDKYFMYRLNDKILTLSEFLDIANKVSITIEEIEKIFEKKYDLEFENRTKDILENIFRHKNYEYKNIYAFIKLILNNSRNDQLKKEISTAVLSYFYNIPKYKDKDLFKATLDLYNYCITELNYFDNITDKFLTCILLKPNLSIIYYNLEELKIIIKNFLVNTKQKISITKGLTNLIKYWGEYRNNFLFTIEELRDIQLNYFKEIEDKFSTEGVNLFIHCSNGTSNNGDSIIRKEALDIMRDAIIENPNKYLDNFIQKENQPFFNNVLLMPTPFYKQIFESNEKFEEFLNKCNTNSTEETRVKNFWELYKSNEYQALSFDSNIDIQEMLNKCFKEQLNQLNELKSIMKKIEETNSISQIDLYQFKNNPLKITLSLKINNKIRNIEQKKSTEEIKQQ